MKIPYLKKLIVGTLVLIFLAMFILGWIINEEYREFKRHLVSYQGVKIGDSMKEVRYAFGLPAIVYGEEEKFFHLARGVYIL